MILDYNRKPDATVDEKVQSLMESTQLALNDIARAQDTADVAKEDAQTSIALSQTARQAANEASESAAEAKQSAEEAAEAVEAIEGDVSGLKTRVTQAESDIDAAESSISSLGTRVGTAEGKITTIEGDVTSLEGSVTSLSGRVTQAESDIDSVEGDITTLQGDVSTAKSDITTLKSDVSTAKGDITTIQGDITNLSGRVSDAEDDIDAVEGDISTLQSDVSTAQSNISTIQTNITDLTGRVSDAEDDIDAVEGDISTLQSDVSTAQGDISTIQGNISTLTGKVADAEDDITAVEGDITNLQGRVSDAEDNVEDVMKGLALAEDVVGTLTWITAHSTVTTDTTPQQGTVYYIKHLDGTFEAVTDTTGKNPAQEGWYVLDEALQNYVLSHLSLQNDGLYVMKDGSHWKVQIADNGVYILDPNDDPANQMTGSGNIIGYDDETHAEIDYHSLRLIARNETTPYFWISDLRDKNDDYQATITETFTADGIEATFRVQLDVSAEVSATDSSHSSNTATRSGQGYTFATTPSEGAIVTIVYKTISEKAKAYTLGQRGSGGVGAMSVAEGYSTTASGMYSHAEGGTTTASGGSSHAEGTVTSASGMYSHAEGVRTTAGGQGSHAEGFSTTAYSSASHAEGFSTTAGGQGSHAEGVRTAAYSSASHAEGENTTASGFSSHAEGHETTASSSSSHAEGVRTTADGPCSHAEGLNTTASGDYSHAEGDETTASGFASHAQNQGTIAQRRSQTALGEYNISDTQGTDDYVRGKYAVIVGNGTGDNARSNALTIDWSGNVDASGDITDGSGNVLSDKADSNNVYTKLESDTLLAAKADASSVPTATSDLINDSGFITQETDPTVPSWAKASSKPTYTASEISGLIDFLRPVGTSYSTIDASFDPNTAWGGTWEKLPEGYVLMSGSASGSYIVGDDTSTGSGFKEYGENSHVLTTDEMPAHTHGNKSLTGYFTQRNFGTGSGQLSWTGGIMSITRNNTNSGYNVASTSNQAKMDTYYINASHEHSSVGLGQAHDIMQKSIAVYWWIRTA